MKLLYHRIIIILIFSFIYCKSYSSRHNYNKFNWRLNSLAPQLSDRWKSNFYEKSDYRERPSYSSANQQCFDNVHKKCLVVSDYTEQDVENVRLYLQRRFAKTNPAKPVCRKLRVRKDFKCLSFEEKNRLFSVFLKLYDNGVMDRFSLIHGQWWSEVHKAMEGVSWHRWFLNEMEKEMIKIDPSVTLPYWDYTTEFAAPEQSSMWKYWGTAGTKEDDYCIRDGVFANQMVKYPTPHCIRRQWNLNGTIPVWEPPEWKSSAMQANIHNWPIVSQLTGFTAHFKTHLHLGGWAGDMSDIFATNDPLFYPFHVHADYVTFRWQLSENANLVPRSYNLGIRWDTEASRLMPSNIDTDVLTYFTDATVRETWQVGYGELCYIHDLLIKPINDIIKNQPLVLPPVVERLKQTLPPRVFATYYPKFASNQATFFDYMFVDVGDCPPRDRCRPFPAALPYNSTPNGMRQLQLFQYPLNLDITPEVFSSEFAYYEFISDLNSYNYCSPYNV